jgi:hypothetical protein
VLASAVALSISTGVNATKAVWPCSKALITPLRRGISGIHGLLFIDRLAARNFGIANGPKSDNQLQIVLVFVARDRLRKDGRRGFQVSTTKYLKEEL